MPNLNRSALRAGILACIGIGFVLAGSILASDAPPPPGKEEKAPAEGEKPAPQEKKPKAEAPGEGKKEEEKGKEEAPKPGEGKKAPAVPKEEPKKGPAPGVEKGEPPAPEEAPSPAKPTTPPKKPAEKSMWKNLSVELHGLFSIPVSGDAGAGQAAPSYAEAFGAGFGDHVKIGFALTPILGLRLDLGGMMYPGKEFDALGTTNRFSRMVGAHLLLGVDLYYPLEVDRKKWFQFEDVESFTGFAFHFAFRFGLQYVDHIRWVEPEPAWSYWDSSVGGLLAIWMGADYRLKNKIGFFAGLECLYADPSPTADRSGARASADGMFAVGMTLGIGYYF
ncbi:MAG: hypothetical protein ACYTHM_10900 [Planctomycetota bacterium]|jgi:hypothetical protein